MNCSSPNRILWVYYRILERSVLNFNNLKTENEKKDQLVLIVMLGINLVEAFVNMYFRILAEDLKYNIDIRNMIINDLEGDNGNKPKGLKTKLDHWPNKVFNKSLKWQKGIAKEFNDLREIRNKLMHFTSFHETIKCPGIEIRGCAKTDCYDELINKYKPIDIFNISIKFIEEILLLSGIENDKLSSELRSWLGHFQ